MKIAICDDEIILADYLKGQISFICESIQIRTHISTYSSGIELLNDYKINSFDVLFLDIHMPEICGFSIAQKIRDISQSTLIVFVTSKDELVFESFNYQPFGFITKGDTTKMSLELTKVMSRIFKAFKQRKTFEIKDTFHGSKFVSLNDIIYISSERHYLNYYLNNFNPNLLIARGSIAEQTEQLGNYQFIRIHRQYLVNMNHIEVFDAYSSTLTVANSDKLPISQSYKKDAINQYNLYMRK